MDLIQVCINRFIYDIILLRFKLGGKVMKKSVIVTILFLIFLVIVFSVFFNDKKMIAVFASIGAAIYAANIKRIKDSENE